MKFFTFMAIFFSTSCGFRQYELSDGARMVELYLGFMTPPISDSSKTHLLRSKQLGLWREGSSLGLGYHSARSVTTESDCQVVFWVETMDSVKKVIEEFEGFENICVVEQ